MPFLYPIDARLSLTGKPNRLVHYLSLHTASEFLVFLHNLPAFLDGHPAVRHGIDLGAFHTFRVP